MNPKYHPSSSYEKFGVKVYHTLVENFPQTYFVGGMVRDMLLRKKIQDIDLTTSALPQQVERVLQRHGIAVDSRQARYGVISAKRGPSVVEIATFRRDLKAPNRYPKVRFIKSPRADSSRRDFTINALYYDLKSQKIYDFHGGLGDLKERQIKFVGNSAQRIKEDPLRIVRALRFQLQLKFTLEKKTQQAIQKYFAQIKKLSRSKIETEILKLPTAKQQKTLRKIINSLPLDI